MRRISPRTYARVFVSALEETPPDHHEQLIERLIGLVRKNRDTRKLDLILSAVESLIDERAGVTHAVITAVHPLAPDARAVIEKKLHQVIGKKVRITEAHDLQAVGGTQIRIGDLLIDGTVRGRLQKLRTSLA